MIAIRPYQKADRTALVLLMIEAQVDYNEPVPRKRNIEKWLGKLPAGVEIFLADNQKKVVGFLSVGTLLSAVGSPRFYIQDLYICKKHRRKGIGRKFMVKIAKLAVERGYDRVIWSVFNDSEAAINFYEKIGAEARPRMIYHRLMGKNLKAIAYKAKS